MSPNRGANSCFELSPRRRHKDGTLCSTKRQGLLKRVFVTRRCSRQHLAIWSRSGAEGSPKKVREVVFVLCK